MPRTFASPPRGATGATGPAGAGLTPVLSSADASLSGTVGQLDVIDISGYSADRTYTLPATAAVGDRCGVMISTGDDAYELLITAAGGDTLNGIAGGTEWSRIFISREILVFVCTVADTTWIVEEDGRIPMKATMRITTETDLTQSGSTWYRVTSEGGAWTLNGADVGNISDVATDKMTLRRACRAIVSAGYRPRAGATGAKMLVLSLNGTGPSTSFAAYIVGASAGPVISGMGNYNAGDTLQFMVWQASSNQGVDTLANSSMGHFSVTEVL